MNLFGWKKEPKDERDFKFQATKRELLRMPRRVDLRDLGALMPEVYYQQRQDCTAHSVGFLVHFAKRKKGEAEFYPSMRFQYYNTGILEGTEKEDSGRYNRDSLKATNRWGVCHIETWPYESAFDERPSKEAYAEGEKSQTLMYFSVERDIDQLKARISSACPVVFGFYIYKEFVSQEVARTGDLPIPDKQNDEVQGGHSIAAVGYDDKTRKILIRNSWGKDWGQAGHFWMPYEYYEDPELSDDPWTIILVE